MAESTFEKSFIPQSDARATTRVQEPNSLSNMIGGGIFLITALVALGVFLFEQYIDGSIDRLTQEIAVAAENINQDTLQRLTDFDTRVKSVGALLNNHNASSNVLNTVGASTITSIQFDSLVFEDRGGVPFVTITGNAPDFRSVAAQVGVLRANQDFQNALVSALSIQQSTTARGVLFTIEAELDRSILAYNPNVTVEAPAVAEEDDEEEAEEEDEGSDESEEDNSTQE